MVDAYLVEYHYYGDKQRFITLDRTRAEEYAARHNGIIYGLIKWLDNSNESPLLSTTSKDACCQPVATAT